MLYSIDTDKKQKYGHIKSDDINLLREVFSVPNNAANIITMISDKLTVALSNKL